MTRGTALTILAGTAGAAGALLIAWPARQASSPDPACRLAVVWDRSNSTATGCKEVLALVERELKPLETQSGSEGVDIAFLVTGEAAGGSEPRLLLNKKLMMPPEIIHGAQRYSKDRTATLGQLRSHCEEARRTRCSPIYVALARAAQHLRGTGCLNGASNCVLAGITDGQETQSFRWRRPANLPPPIDNTGIHVKICGLAETSTAASSDPDVSTMLEETWKSLFVQKELVTLEPFCPQ
jgi:hypothetical protein